MGSGKRRSGDWRDRASEEVLLSHLLSAPPGSPLLLAGDQEERVQTELEGAGVVVTPWHRRLYREGQVASPWPPEGSFPAAALRLPRSKEEMVMSAHALASRLEVGGTLLVYGAKDEGIVSAVARLADVPGLSDAETVAVKARCRVLRCRRTAMGAELRDRLSDWRQERVLDLPGGPLPWVGYPGLFAGSELDPGTRLLLASLPPIPSEARVLDFGCGSGVIGGEILRRQPEARIDLLDHDTVALVAAAENVPAGRAILSSGPRALDPESPYDWIVSNPPYHSGKAEDLGVVGELVEGAPGLLTRRGTVVMVVQRRLAVRDALAEGFARVETLGEDATYRVWMARGPIRRGSPG
jgi:16S rRNA (guanine1207-N2)-methyltransferase